MFVEYKVGSRYREPDEEPPVDSVGLFLEGIPIYKIWYAPPLDVELACLEGTCTHIGLLPPTHFPGGMPLFLFRSAAGQSFLVRAPLGAIQEQVEHWATADSNEVMFTLIERGSQIIRQNRIIGITGDFRQRLAKAWLSVKHPVDMRQCQSLLAGMTDQALVNAATLWAYNSKIDEYEQLKSRSTVM